MSRLKMKKVRLTKGNDVVFGWIEDKGARKGSEVELIGDGFWTVDEILDQPVND